MADISDDELLAELGVSIETKTAGGLTPREERIIAGFEDIQRFFEKNGRAPQHGEEGDIFERLYAVQLDRLRALPEARVILSRNGCPRSACRVIRPGSARYGSARRRSVIG